jgi:hypothetical protein
MLGNYKPGRPFVNALETINVQVTASALSLTGPGQQPRPPSRLHLPEFPDRDAFRSAPASLAGWLASLPHRFGGWLFARNDREAGWRRWEVTELRRGFARSYRDPRFDLLRALRAFDQQQPGNPSQAVPDPAKVVRPADGWDDVHGWPWDGEG